MFGYVSLALGGGIAWLWARRQKRVGAARESVLARHSHGRKFQTTPVLVEQLHKVIQTTQSGPLAPVIGVAERSTLRRIFELARDGDADALRVYEQWSNGNPDDPKDPFVIRLRYIVANTPEIQELADDIDRTHQEKR